MAWLWAGDFSGCVSKLPAQLQLWGKTSTRILDHPFLGPRTPRFSPNADRVGLYRFGILGGVNFWRVCPGVEEIDPYLGHRIEVDFLLCAARTCCGAGPSLLRLPPADRFHSTLFFRASGSLLEWSERVSRGGESRKYSKGAFEQGRMT